jgi:NADPH:quinone reductase
MRALVVEELTGPTGVRVADIAPPPASQAAVRVAVTAAGVGFVDTLLSRGRYQVRPELPFVLGLEFAGTVADAPTDSGYRIGDAVVGHVMGGGCAETVWGRPHLLAPLPAGLTPEQGAASVVNHHTALVALSRRARLRSGERVLVHGAGGGLGSATVQVAAALGAEVLAVAGSPARRALARTAGATTVYTPDEWVDAVRNAGGADIVVDPVGGEVFEQSVRCLASEGRLVTVGFTSGTIPCAAANRLLLRNAGVLGAAWRELLAVDPTLFTSTAAQLADLVAHGLRPLIGARYDLSDGAEALAAIEQREMAGKVVLRV